MLFRLSQRRKAAVPAVAAGLAAIFLLRHPSVPVDNGVQIIPQPVNPVAVVNDQDESPGQVPVEPQAVKSPMPKVARQTVADSWQPEVVDDNVLTEVEEKADTTVQAKVQDSAHAPAMYSPITATSGISYRIPVIISLWRSSVWGKA